MKDKQGWIGSTLERSILTHDKLGQGKSCNNQSKTLKMMRRSLWLYKSHEQPIIAPMSHKEWQDKIHIKYQSTNHRQSQTLIQHIKNKTNPRVIPNQNS